MAKKKVLFLLEAFDKGGIEKITLDIVNNLNPEKYDITIQTFWFGGHCQSLVAPYVKVIPFFFRRYVRGIIRLIQYLPPRILYRIFVHGKYDVEIACSDGGAAKVISGSTNLNSRKICWVHMDVVERGSKLKEYQSADSAQHIYSKFDRIACVSQKGLDRFKVKFGNYPDMVAVHNPLLDEIIRKRALEFSVKRNSPVEFVTVGRIEEEKGFDRLAEAALRLKCDRADFHIRIVGDGGNRPKLEEYIHANHLDDVISLEGFQENPYPYVAASDWYVCCSLDECFSLAVGEAFCLGKPILGTDCTGVREWLGDSTYGIVVENSIDGIYSGLKHILQMEQAEVNRWISCAQEQKTRLSFASLFDNWQKEILGE